MSDRYEDPLAHLSVEELLGQLAEISRRLEMLGSETYILHQRRQDLRMALARKNWVPPKDKP